MLRCPISLRQWAESEIREPMIRHLFYALCRTATYSRDIDYQLTGPVIKQLQRSLKSGVRYIDGGWQTIIDQLRELAARNGVTILHHKHVREIEYDTGCGSCILKMGIRWMSIRLLRRCPRRDK